MPATPHTHRRHPRPTKLSRHRREISDVVQQKPTSIRPTHRSEASVAARALLHRDAKTRVSTLGAYKPLHGLSWHGLDDRRTGPDGFLSSSFRGDSLSLFRRLAGAQWKSTPPAHPHEPPCSGPIMIHSACWAMLPNSPVFLRRRASARGIAKGGPGVLQRRSVASSRGTRSSMQMLLLQGCVRPTGTRSGPCRRGGTGDPVETVACRAAEDAQTLVGVGERMRARLFVGTAVLRPSAFFLPFPGTPPSRPLPRTGQGRPKTGGLRQDAGSCKA